MTNDLSHRFGRGLRAGVRSPGRGGRAGALLATLGLLVSALPALAAEIVEVRVGRHPTFTRVVFELDRPAGYRIERSDPSSGAAELVVSLEAASIPRSIDANRKSLIRKVDVEPQGRRSVARVALTQDGLRLKEMILANPPRIVLDLLNDEPATPVAQKPAPKPERAARVPEAAADEGDDFDDVVAGLGGSSAPVEPEPAQAPVEVARAESPTPSRVIPAAAPTAATDTLDEAMAQVEDAAAEAGELVEDAQGAVADAADAVADEAGAMDLAAGMGSDEPSTSTPIEADEPLVADATPPAPKPKRVPPPMVARSTTPEDEGGGWMTMALVGAGALVLLVGGGLFLARRRGASDDDEWDDDADDAGFGLADSEAATDNPFASADESTTLGAPDDETVVAPMSGTDDEDTTVVSVPDDEKESESLFDAEEKDMDDMEVISRDQVNESLGGPAMPPVGGASDDVQAMFAEMTRRMEALEARCDELVDARDRLERQVAAQTEELRVQRAAIARTQRAVRNLGRGEGEPEGDEPTEPALRDPNQ